MAPIACCLVKTSDINATNSTFSFGRDGVFYLTDMDKYFDKWIFYLAKMDLTYVVFGPNGFGRDDFDMILAELDV
jgi:hypothetical protein